MIRWGVARRRSPRLEKLLNWRRNRRPYRPWAARPPVEEDDEPRTAHPALADREPWSGGFAANH